jgi:dynein heavy chain
MERYNVENPSKKLELVLFDDALKHLLRVSRIIKTERSSALLVGVGGSGKKSLTKLASYIGHYEIAQITLTKGFGETQLRDFIREFYNWSGHLNTPSTFLLTDAEIRYEWFLEFINMILSTGEIPNLIAKDDRDVWLLNIKAQLQKKKGKSYDPTAE